MAHVAPLNEAQRGWRTLKVAPAEAARRNRREKMRGSLQMQTEMTRQWATDEEELLLSDQDRIQRRR